jgi:hypothetical protein
MHSSSEAGEPSWTPRDLATAVFIVGFLVWQLAVPMAKLAGPRPAQFGWQMFSYLYRPAKVLAVFPDGEARAIEPSVYLALRGDLRYERALARHLCRADSRLAAVRLEPESGAATVLPCRP